MERVIKVEGRRTHGVIILEHPQAEYKVALKKQRKRRRPAYHYEGELTVSSSKRIPFYIMKQIDKQIRALIKNCPKNVNVGLSWHPKLEKKEE